MILGLPADLYTGLHVAISLIAIVTGLFELADLLRGRLAGKWTRAFLLTTVLTSVTGFGFPFVTLLPSHLFGMLSLIVLAAALYALYGRGAQGRWRAAYVTGAAVALYLNFFVLVVQSFLKVPALKALAPTQSEPPFAVAQAIVLVLFVAAGWKAVRRAPALPEAAPA
jgi:hypothetical protein